MNFKLSPNDPSYKKFVRDVAVDLLAIMDERKDPKSKLEIIQDGVLSIQDVHKKTGIKAETLRAHIKCNPPLLKASRPGKHYLIHQKDLNEYLNRNQKN